MAADFVRINGTLFNTADIRHIRPDKGEGKVIVSLNKQHFVFQVEASTEETWAESLAAQIGNVVDTSGTPVERG